MSEQLEDRVWLPLPDPDTAEYWWCSTGRLHSPKTVSLVRVQWGTEIFGGAERAIIGNNLYTDEVKRIIETPGVTWSPLTDEEAGMQT